MKPNRCCGCSCSLCGLGHGQDEDKDEGPLVVFVCSGLGCHFRSGRYSEVIRHKKMEHGVLVGQDEGCDLEAEGRRPLKRCRVLLQRMHQDEVNKYVEVKIPQQQDEAQGLLRDDPGESLPHQVVSIEEGRDEEMNGHGDEFEAEEAPLAMEQDFQELNQEEEKEKCVLEKKSLAKSNNARPFRRNRHCLKFVRRLQDDSSSSLPFGCLRCPFRSGSLLQVEWHVSASHLPDVLPYKCTDCQEAFGHTSLLMNHAKARGRCQ